LRIGVERQDLPIWCCGLQDGLGMTTGAQSSVNKALTRLRMEPCQHFSQQDRNMSTTIRQFRYRV
jgi:hypothetical protein